MDDPPGDVATSRDALLGGRLLLRQPVKGHRVGSDAILLAAAAPAKDVTRLVDVGAGVGAVGLAVLQRLTGASADLVEQDAQLAALARENAARNGLEAQSRIVRVDLMDARARRAAGLANGAADLVVTNPPFFEAQSGRVSPDANRASAHVFPAKAPGDPGAPPLESWIVALAQILSAIARRLGSVAILPIHPRAGAPAHRILIAGKKGARGPIRLLAGFVLHDSSGAFTPWAEAVHRGEALIDWGEGR